MASNEPERLPSARTGRIPFVVTRSRVLPRTRSLAASPPGLVKGWVVAPSYPAPSRLASRRPELDVGKMRLTDFCNRPTTRAPFGLLDSRSRLLQASRGAPCGTPRATLRSAPSALGRSLLRTRVEPRLTASLQLRLRHDTPAFLTEHPGHRSFLAGLRSTAPPNDATRTRSCRPRSRLVTWPLTPSVAPVPPGKPGFAGSQIRVRHRLVKGDGFSGSERLPSTNTLSSPLSRRVRKGPRPWVTVSPR